MAQIFSLKNSKFFSGLKKMCAIVTPITTISTPSLYLINNIIYKARVVLSENKAHI